jgi:hypothetical protein
MADEEYQHDATLPIDAVAGTAGLTSALQLMDTTHAEVESQGDSSSATRDSQRVLFATVRFGDQKGKIGE